MSRRRRLAALILLTLGAGACTDPPTAVTSAPDTAPRALVAPGAGTSAVISTRGLLITPVGLDFGEVQTGTTSPTQLVNVTNVSGASMSMNIAGGAPPGSDFNASQNCQSVTLAPGASCQIFYTFQPTTAGPATSTSAGSVNGQAFSIALRGSGVGPRFRIASTALDFGDVVIGSTLQLSIDLTNIGRASVTGSIAGGAAGAFGGSQNCQGATIAVGGKCQLFYQFSPTDTGVITATTNGSLNGQPFAFTFRGRGIAPSFRISPTALDFGQLRVGQSLTLPVTITNVGVGSVVGSIAGGAAGAFGGSQNCQSATIPVGGSCQIFYTFQPTAEGTVTATTNGSFNGQPFALTFTGTGIGATASPSVPFRISARALDFGDAQVGTSVQLAIDFTNISGAPIVGSIAGGAAGAFGGSQNCQGATIAPGASCQIFYTFQPTAAGVVTGSANGSLNGQPFAFTFRGTGVAPSFRISPTSIDFGRLQTGTTLTLPVTITNVGRAAVVGSIAGGAAGAFGGSQNCQGATIPVGGSCQVFYTFSPTTPGVVTGSTNGSFNGQPFAFTFTGLGVAPSFRITPFAFDFGEVAFGTTSPSQAVTVTNTGMAPVEGSIAGGAAGVFGGSQNCQSATLAVGASCQIFYQFTPSIIGPVTASTNGSFNGQPFGFTFMGTGTGAEQAMDLAPTTISLTTTPVTNAVLLSAPGFDAVAVTVANVRMVVNGTTEVAPIMRGTVVNTSVGDFNGDGRPDRLFGFRTSDLVAAGLTTSPGAATLVLRDRLTSSVWQARDPMLPKFVP